MVLEPQSFLLTGFCIQYLYILNELLNTKTEFELKQLDSAEPVTLRLTPPLSTWDDRSENSLSYRFQLTFLVANTLSLTGLT